MKQLDQNLQVLIVDDTPANVDVLVGILRDDYQLKVALNGKKALDTANSIPPPDLILLDVMMPEMGGYEVCQKLKENPQTEDIPVIFVTANTEVKDEMKGFELGAVDYITKPVNRMIVQSRVRAHLALGQVRAQLKRHNKELEEKLAGGFSEFLPDMLKQLILEGESESLEFKSTLRHNLHSNKNDKSIENAVLKTIAGFLNSQGGHLLVGVNDDGVILGMEKDSFLNSDRVLLHLNNLICAHLGPQVAPLLRSNVTEVDDLNVLSVQCLTSPSPVFVRRDGTETFYVRMGPASRQLSPSEVLAHVQSRS